MSDGLDALVDQQIANRKKEALQSSLNAGMNYNPDAYAKQLKVGTTLGVNPAVVPDNATAFEKAARLKEFDFDSFIKQSPKTSQWVSQNDNAAVSHDDLENLGSIESGAARIGALSFGDRLKTNYDNGDFSFVPGLKSVKALVKTVAETPAVRDLPVNYGKTLGQAMDDAGFLYSGVNKPLDTSLLQPVANGVDYLANNRPEVTKGVIPDAVWNVIAGVSKGEARSAAGLATPKNLAILLSSGNLSPIAKALLDTYFASEMIPGVVQTPQRIMQAPNLQEKVAAGFEGLVNAIFTKGVVQGIGSTHPFYEDMANVITFAELSKLRKRSPEKFNALAKEIFDGQDSLRIPAEQFDVYFQSQNMNPAEVAQQIGAKNYLEAKATGGHVEVSPADFISRLEPEHQKGLLGDIVNPADGMTFNQKQQGAEELQKFVAEGGMEKVLAEAQKSDQETQASPEYQDIKSQIRQRYLDAGETPEIADNYATLQANVYSNLAREVGMKPTEVMALWNPRIVAGEAPDGGLNQGDRNIVTLYRGIRPEADGHSEGVTYYSPDRAIAGQYGDVGKHTLDLTDARILNADSTESRQLVAEFLGESPDEFTVQNPESYDDAASKVFIDKSGDFAKFLASRGYDGFEHGPEVGIFNPDKWNVFHQGSPVRVEYDENGNITDGDGRHRVIAALERGDSYIEVQTKMRDGSVQTLKVDPAKVAEKLGVTPESLAKTDAQQNEFFKVLKQSAEDNAGSPRGWFRVLPDGSFEIGKTKIGDLSTFVHEPAHSYLFLISDLAKREGASETLKSDHQKILDFLGAQDGEPLTTEQHEKWARANEQYLREGKAPSNSLRGVFQRFSVWLSTIYKKASDLGVELSDDIRGVMDRMYAAEEGVNRAAQDQGPRLFTEADLSPEEAAKYAEAKGLELDQAKAEIVAKMNEAAVRERTDAWKGEEQNTRAAVTTEIDQRPEYTAIRSLRRGKLDDGTPLTLNRDELIKQFGKERVDALNQKYLGIYRAGGGVDAEAAAEILGFNSGEEMVRALENVPRRTQAIEDATRAYMTAKHGDIRYDGTLDDQARIALENDKKASNLHKELKDLQKKLDQVQAESSGQKAAARAVTVPPVDAFRTAAEVMIAEKPIMDLQPIRYLDASRVASREAFDALRKGDVEKAAAAKSKELLNHFFFREATKVKAEADKTYSQVQKYKSGKVRETIAKAGGEQGQHVYLDQIDNILEQFQFTKETNKAIRQKYEDFAAQKQAEWLARFFDLNPNWTADHPGEAPEIPQIVDTSIVGMAKNYRELNISELRAVRDALKNVETLARREWGILRNGHLVSFAQEVADFERVSRENNTTKGIPRSGTKLTGKEAIIDRVHGLDAAMQKMEWFIDQLDGGDINGPARRNIKQPIDDAWGESLRMGDEIFGKLKELVEARPKEDVTALDDSTGIQFPKSDRPLNRRQLISWALNLGTAENQKVALIGEGLVNLDGSPSPIVSQALNSLRSSELRFIQGVWDILESMRPAIEAKALRENGVAPKMKQVTPFDVTSVEGEKIHMRGGYYPLKGEPGDRVGQKQTDPAQMFSVGSMKPKTSTSHLQQVTGATYRLLLDYENVLSKHLADVISDTTKGEAIAQVYKFLSEERVRTTIQETLGAAESKEFMEWLRDFAGNNRSGVGDNLPLVQWLMSRRSGMVVARLGGNLSSYLIQFGDVFKSLADPDIKTKYIAKAFLDIRRNPTELIEQIRGLSPNEMAHREKNFNRDIRDMLESKSPFDQKKQLVTEFLMEGFAVMDRMVTFPAWLGRFRQGMAEHGDQARAVKEADRAIARDYMAGDNRNMSRMMRAGGLTRLLTTFQGDANTWYGLISSSIRSGNPRAISVAIMALVAEQMVGQFIRNRGPKDDQNYAGWGIEQALLAGLNLFPVAGDVGQYGLSKLTGQYASLQNPTMQALEKTGAAPGSIYNYTQGKKDAQETLMDLTEATGIYVGIPGTSQAIRTWKYVHRVQTGKEPAPKNTYEFVRGALQGSNKKQ